MNDSILWRRRQDAAARPTRCSAKVLLLPGQDKLFSVNLGKERAGQGRRDSRGRRRPSRPQARSSSSRLALAPSQDRLAELIAIEPESGPLKRGSTYYWLTGMNPSVSVCMKLTIASSSASDRPRRPTRLVFMLSVDSGAGQHVVPSLTSWGWQRGRTSRVL